MGRYFLLLIIILVSAGCKDCTRYTYGYVVDKETSKPIPGAKVRSYAALNDRARDERIVFTDTSGWFETAFALEGVAKCGNLKLIITDTAYHTAYEVDMPEGDTVFLLRKKV